jgi:hypothetical protein
MGDSYLKSKNFLYIIIIALLAIAVYYAVVSFSLSQSYQAKLVALNQSCESKNNVTQDLNTDFFENYSIALSNIYAGQSYIQLAVVNLHKVNEYASPNATGYDYETAANITELGKQQAAKAGDYFIEAKNSLETIQDSVSNDFFSQDISNRVEQTNYLIIYAEHYYTLLDYTKKQLYEINYGSEAIAQEYFNKYNALIPEVNANLAKLDEVQNKIDAQWGQDWYPALHETAE